MESSLMSFPFITDLSVLVFNQMALIFHSFKSRYINFRYVFQIWKSSGTTYQLVMTYNSVVRPTTYNSVVRPTTYNSVVRPTTYIRLNFRSSQKTYFKVNCKNNLCINQTTSSTDKASPSTQNLKRKIKILVFLAECGEKVREMLCLVYKNGERRRLNRFWEH
ncbi:hypothetical protein IGI04_023551 [Brassica rapa subsp. trilocularis]|uniref:Uncharacterized protein n=1 Tax=Brassica rapa subsp. trilocularis TaxID=1813537 RepID=A0ABQ7M474_BRACM|nr:hypothetical protein IGI04_023551 [Brassica rapa subsp. trilocularis]